MAIYLLLAIIIKNNFGSIYIILLKYIIYSSFKNSVQVENLLKR